MASLLRYTPGAKPGKALKRPHTESEKNEAKKRYENSRERKFKPEWLVGRDWLLCENGKMKCKLCCEAAQLQKDKESAFVVGCGSLKLEYVKKHEKTKLHLQCYNKATFTEVEQQKTPTTASKCLASLKKCEFDQLAIKFRTAHYIAKTHKSYRDYVNICKLDRAKGLDIGDGYITDKAAALMVSSIAKTTMLPVIKKLHDAPFFSFTCDGSSDFTGDDMESLYVRTSVKGVVQDSFVNIGMAKSASSANILDHIEETFHTLGLAEVFQKNLVGFCSDGAANMQGIKSGLAALLKKTRPHLVAVHCLAHRLELAFKDAMKGNKLYDKVMTLLLGLYYLYRKSPKLKNGLRNCFEALQLKPAMPTRVGGTRWLPHLDKALKTFLKTYRPIRQHLETASHDNPKAGGLAKIARDGHLIAFMLSLREFIYPLVCLSKSLQRDNITLADAFAELSSTTSILKQKKEKEYQHIQEVIDTASYEEEALTFRGKKPNVAIPSLIETMLACLGKRFPDTDIIAATKIANLRNWPNADNQAEYGNTQLSTVTRHFAEPLERAGIEIDNVEHEWPRLKALVYAKYQDELTSGTLTWDVVNRGLADSEVGEVLTVVDLLLSLPPTSVKNECCFSIMKLTKNKRRARLSTGSLNNVMIVHQLSSPIESFEPKAAIEHFMALPSGRPRRPAGYKQRAKKVGLQPEPEASTSTIVVESSEEETQEEIEMVQFGDSYDDESEEEEDEGEMDMTEEETNLKIQFYASEE